MQGNTVGSRSSTQWAYIAGFIDGDGSLMLQIKRRSDSNRGYRFMATICMYQDTRHEKPLFWIKKIIGIGYITRRNDSMTELRINGFSTIKFILNQIEPFTRFKRVQVKALLEACRILETDVSKLTKEQLHRLVELIILIQNENYQSGHKKSKQELLKILGLTP